MKKVIDTTPENAISLQDVEAIEYPLVGFHTNRGKGNKATLVPVAYWSKCYFARAKNAWNEGNGYSPNAKREYTLSEWARFFFEIHDAEMFVFDSPEELFKWLAE